MWQFAAYVVGALSALYLWHDVKPFVARFLNVLETKHGAAPSQQSAPVEPMPPDLEALAQSFRSGVREADDLMSEQTKALLYEKYAELKDWDQVRAWSAQHMDFSSPELGEDLSPNGYGRLA